jgi:hypothetical protein
VPQPVIGAPFVRPVALLWKLGMPKNLYFLPVRTRAAAVYMFREGDLDRATRAVSVRMAAVDASMITIKRVQ